LPGSPCDDGNADTGNDVWTADCTCVGAPLDCVGVPGGPALPGSPCDDGNANTGNDAWTGTCVCIGQPLDCVGAPGGLALPGTPCDDGDPATVNDVWSSTCICTGIPLDCAGVLFGTAFVDECGTCAGGTTGILPNPDLDSDGIVDCLDNCPGVSNPMQGDFDNDGVGDLCDNCPWQPNADQADGDGDGIGDVCDEVGIAEHGGMIEIRMHPNPTLGLLRLEPFMHNAREVLIQDGRGAVVLRLPYHTVLNVSVLAQGTYLLTVVDGNGTAIGRVRMVRL
jgi:hypothetical protein